MIKRNQSKKIRTVVQAVSILRYGFRAKDGCMRLHWMLSLFSFWCVFVHASPADGAELFTYTDNLRRTVTV